MSLGISPVTKFFFFFIYLKKKRKKKEHLRVKTKCKGQQGKKIKEGGSFLPSNWRLGEDSKRWLPTF
jgi:hypothetical protein